jgi:2,3-bisphosphoglycerate-dependent phosphoglycerate mutase
MVITTMAKHRTTPPTSRPPVSDKSSGPRRDHERSERMPISTIRIFLIRHGQSEANLDKSINTRLPDHKIELSGEGREQAAAVGKFLARTLTRSRRLRILCSPYIRARQTSDLIEKALLANAITFDKREAIELRELQFGLFDGIADEDLPKLFPREYEHYGQV